MKYLVIGLGNIGDEYAHTRHNIGFDIADFLAQKHKCVFTPDRYADHVQINLKGKHIHLIKPNTYMNLSGKAVRYWIEKLKIDTSNIFVLVDDLAIPYGKIRIRANGSDAGHNGLKNINECLLTQQYARLRFGIGAEYAKGRQVDFVLSKWNDDENKLIDNLISKSAEAIESFVLSGINNTMNQYNK